MISIIKHIENVSISFGEEKIISTLPHIHSSDTVLDLSLPTDITFNENWIVSHSCDCDDETISFSKGLKQNWTYINKLFSRFYEIEMLEQVADAFDSLKMYESEKAKYTFLTRSNFDEVNVPIYSIPQVNFNTYQCKNCFRDYLCRLTEGVPREADPNFPKGLEGKLIIHEIVEFEYTTDNHFHNFLKDKIA